MMKLKRLGALTLTLALTLSALSGCGNPSTGGSSSGDSPQTASIDLSQVTDPYLVVSGLAADEVIVTVGDVEVPAAEYLYWLNRVIVNYLSQFGGAMTTLPWDTEMTEGLTFGQYFLNQAEDTAIFHGILRHMAQTEGLSVDPSIASALHEDYVNRIIAAGSDETRVIHSFWGSLLTQELLITLSGDNDLYSQLWELYYGEDSDGYPTDAEVNAYLDEHGCFRVKHILLSTTDRTTDEPLEESEITRKKALADDLLTQLQASDDRVALFDQLMDEYSEDEGLLTNPDGYTFDETDSLVGGFREAALALAVGEISNVVETDYGYHILLRLPIDPAEYRNEYASTMLSERIDGERERQDVVRTAAFDKLNVDSFWNNMQSLQSAIQAELAR